METVRNAIQKSPHSRYAIAKQTGVDASVLCRIMQGKTCSAEVADKLLSYFGYKLVKSPKRQVKP